MKKLPYGISNFSSIATEGYYYVDRTAYIERLEAMGEKTILFIRPRRFGKSLLVSMLHHYYGLEHAARFSDIFGAYYIGQQPTPLANQYLVLKLDFSGIDTSSVDHTYRDFLEAVKIASTTFLDTYKKYFTQKELKVIKEAKSPQGVLRNLFSIVSNKAQGKKLYVLIDEYDHFANELLAFDFSRFKNTVSRNGWVRKFYEVLKIAIGQGVVDRIFITGISPITLDNLTTGFNIATNISTNRLFNELLGFTEKEVIELLIHIGVADREVRLILRDLKLWYNGYLFHGKGKERVYNPDMILYFAKYYQAFQEYPTDLLDENIAGDYGKMRKMFQINEATSTNLAVLKTLIEKGTIEANLTKKYSFEVPWTRDNFISLLFYMGILTIDKEDLNHVFKMPNYVIRQLYFQFFSQLTLENAQLHPDALDITAKVKALAQHNDLQPIVELVQNIMAQLGMEDRAHFNEVSLKAIFASFFYQVSYFNIFSELEVQKSKQQKGRVDLLLTRRPPYQPTYQFVFELKYLKKKQANQLEKIKANAVTQLETYLKNDPTLKSLENLKAYIIIFTIDSGTIVEI